jgi:hypothetical protein
MKRDTGHGQADEEEYKRIGDKGRELPKGHDKIAPV